MVREMMEALPRLLLAAAVVLGAFLIFEGVTSLLRADLHAKESRSEQHQRAPAAAPAKTPPPDTRAVLVSNTPDTKSRPLRQPPASRQAQRPSQTEGTNTEREAGPCEAGLRIAGAAYMRPSAGDPLVMFSGPGAGKGLRGIGAQVAGKTLVAIYPTAVVLREPDGRECWVKMSSAYAREVASQERRANVRDKRERYREEQREKASARRAANRKKR
jgi:hypothetical protein